MTQQRDTIVVYFDNDKLLVENDSSGRPTARSVENPQFYQLIYTSDTVRNTDDAFFLPQTVTYNATSNTATLKFSTDINNLAGSNAGPATYRLRVGTRESAPITPTRSEAAATVISDLNTNGAVKLRFTALEVGENGSGIQISFINSNSGTPVVTGVGRNLTVDMGRNSLTAQELVDLLRISSVSSNLLTVDFEPGSVRSTVVGNRLLSYSPLTTVGLGSSFDTAANIGTIGSSSQLQTSLILSSSIDAVPYALDLPGASDDPAHRTLPRNLVNDFENHINPNFGADSTDGITTIYYNFQQEYATDLSGTPLTSSISETQKLLARQALGLWSKYIGVQFVETANLGLTIATGSLTALRPITGTQVQLEPALDFGVRIDRTFTRPSIVLNADRVWNPNYGEDYLRTVTAAVGMILGLTHAGDLPATTLMKLDPEFFAGNGALTDPNDAQLDASEQKYEPIFPGNQDILHGQHLYRPDGTDIDLYRFDVDFGGQGKVGIFTAETYAERLPNSSALDTNIQLYRQVQATAETNFGIGDQLSVRFTAVRPGAQGNQLQIFLTQSDRGGAGLPTITVFPNAINIDLNATPGFESTVAELVDVFNRSSGALKLASINLDRGVASTKIGSSNITQNPVVLTGGRMELVAQNDDYFSKDSLIRQTLSSGVYYIGVSASGNDEYNASISGTGWGGQSQGNYELRVTFRGEVDSIDTIQDASNSIVLDGQTFLDPNVGFDGDGDGVPGGLYNFWFQTRGLDRVLSFNAGGSAALEGRTITVVGANGTSREFEFSSDTSIGSGRIRINYSNTSTQGQLASALASAINSRGELGVTATVNGARVTLRGERSITISPNLQVIDVQGKTIFVDKAAGPNADGSLARPFNNIAGVGVPNAFAAAMPGDIVRIVGNGGVDGNIATLNDNFAYEIGVGLLPNSTLSDGRSMDVPKGVTTMIDAGAIFKLRQARIGVGSTNLNIDRSGSALQVLGAPILLNAAGNPVRLANGQTVAGSVYMTSWLDETIGLDNYGPRTIPSAGDWGGISYRRDVDAAAGRKDFEDEGIFLQYANHLDIRYGGGTVLVDSIQQTVNPIEMLDVRPTVTYNKISDSANAAMSALPNSFEETNFHEPRYQLNGAFTSDYDRVGPDIHHNSLRNNSVNGLFIRVDTPVNGTTQSLTVPGRFDDIDIVHVVTENVFVSGSTGGAILDGTVPPVDLISLGPNVGGTLLPGNYNYKITYVDRNGYESIPSEASPTITLLANQTAISLAGIPSTAGDFILRRLYRSTGTGSGPYELVATLDKATSTFLDLGRSLGGTLTRDRAEVSNVLLTDLPTGTLAAGTYNYVVVMVDAAGVEGLASKATSSFTLTANGSIQLDNIPSTLPGYVGRRIYRSANDGLAPYVQVANLPDSTSVTITTIVDDGTTIGGILSAESFGIKRPRPHASLVIDPGSIIKLEGARIEASFGARILAEGTDDLPIIFTSRLDDRYGAGGTFDTNNNGQNTQASPRDWGGIYAAPTSTLSIDHARFSYGGGVTKLEGTFRAFNTIELQQADGRIANSLFENNADGFGGQGPGDRLGRLGNSHSTIFVRGSQPIFLNNTLRNNEGSAIEIDANSMTDTVRGDRGRQTGAADRDPSFDANRGPLFRNNRMIGNGLNGLEIRGDILTTASVWDDTDIAHVLYDGVYVMNAQHEGGLRLQSAPDESLVVKFEGYGSNFNRNLGAGITASGQLTSGDNRVGGTLHVLGQPGFPVILTSLKDDTVAAGLQPNGTPQSDTNNDGIGSTPQAADWRGILLDQYSNDRNVVQILETEDFKAAAPGPNGQVSSAQVLGDLASRPSSSNENLRLGFTVDGVLSQNSDVDVYSFTAEAGTEIWIDVDQTKNNLDMVIDLLDANGSLLARSDSSTDEVIDPSLIVKTDLISASNVNPMPRRTDNVRRTSGNVVKEDGTTNRNDPGLRVLLPGSPGARSTFYFRVRSAGTDITNPAAGSSSGVYQVQVRLQEKQEYAGSAVSFADIRYAMNGIHLRGLPTTSPLIGEAAENESAVIDPLNDFIPSNNSAGGNIGSGNRPQYIGNLLETSLGGISVAGSLSTARDIDFYRVDIRQEDILGTANGFVPVIIDLDYADGLNRPDTSLNVFQAESSQFGGQYRLIYSGDAANIADDLAKPFAGNDLSDLSRGSVGTKDGFIGPIPLAPGSYLIAVSSAAMRPRTQVLNPFSVQPISSIRRIVDEQFIAGVTGAQPPVVTNFLPRTNVGATGELVSRAFNLGAYSASDEPAAYLDYTHPAGTFEVFVRNAAGVETRVATTQAPNSTLLTGRNNLKISLRSFAGQDNLTMVFRSTNPGTTMNNVIIGFAERGEQLGVGDEQILLSNAFLGRLATRSTRTFSLNTYTVAEQPSVTFDYEIFTGTWTYSSRTVSVS